MFTVLGGVVIPIGLLVLLLGWLWMGRFRTRATWAAAAIGASLAINLLFLSSRWDVLGVHWRYALVPIWLVILGSYWRVRHLRWTSAAGEGRARWLAAYVLPNLVLLSLVGWAIAGVQAPDRTISVESPLRGGTYYVLHGGGSPLLNYHGAFDPAYTYALDIVGLGLDGRRAQGLLPADLDRYAIYGEPVYSPIDGGVVTARGNLPDKMPPERDAGRPLGNAVVLQQDSVVIVLAHLQEGSVTVRQGQQVSAGQQIGRVGNSGSTSEPHLHLHALTYAGEPTALLREIHEQGRPLPLRLDGRFLVRNDVFGP